MRIKGFQGTSLLDFPGRIASLVFTGGCNLSCAFCHNPGLVLDPDQYPDYPLDELLADLRQRRTFIDGVVVSGGEPTLAPGLEGFLAQLKEMGLQVKLDTNGLRPDVLERLFEGKLIDYLALDFKTAPARYAELHDGAVDWAALLESCRLAMTLAPEYEVRTTCVPVLVEEAEIHAIGAAIRGARRWVLQQYLPRPELLGDAPSEPRPVADLERFRGLAQSYVEQVEGRGW